MDAALQVRGSQLKYRAAASTPKPPQAATTATSVHRKGVPRNPACKPTAKWRTGNTLAIHRIHAGALLPPGRRSVTFVPFRLSQRWVDRTSEAGEESVW